MDAERIKKMGVVACSASRTAGGDNCHAYPPLRPAAPAMLQEWHRGATIQWAVHTGAAAHDQASSRGVGVTSAALTAFVGGSLFASTTAAQVGELRGHIEEAIANVWGVAWKAL